MVFSGLEVLKATLGCGQEREGKKKLDFGGKQGFGERAHTGIYLCHTSR